MKFLQIQINSEDVLGYIKGSDNSEFLKAFGNAFDGYRLKTWKRKHIAAEKNNNITRCLKQP